MGKRTMNPVSFTIGLIMTIVGFVILFFQLLKAKKVEEPKKEIQKIQEPEPIHEHDETLIDELERKAIKEYEKFLKRKVKKRGKKKKR